MKVKKLETTYEDNALRLDVYLGEKLDVSRSYINKIIKAGYVKKDGEVVSKVGLKIKPGEVFIIELPEEGEEIPKPQPAAAKETQQQLQEPVESAAVEASGSATSTTTEKQTVPLQLDIVYEDDSLAIINKPAGMVVHPAENSTKEEAEATLANLLIKKYGRAGLSNITDEDYVQEKGGQQPAAGSQAPKLSIRPGIVHRIDSDTSGVIVVAKTNEAHLHLKEQFKRHTIKRRYVSLILNELPYDQGTIDAAIGRHPSLPNKRVAINMHHSFRKQVSIDHDDEDEDEVQKPASVTKSNQKGSKKVNKTELTAKAAVTHYKMLETFNIDASEVLRSAKCKQKTNKVYKICLIECELETGRTHQIRVHFNAIGRPLLGDRMYGANLSVKKPTPDIMALNVLLTGTLEGDTTEEQSKNGGQLLHAAILGFTHPKTKKYVEFTAPLPKRFEDVLQRVRKFSPNVL